MLVKRNHYKEKNQYEYSIAIGNFDGIHKGHRYLLNELIKCRKSSKNKIAVISFSPHPLKVLAKKKWKKNLSNLRIKYSLLKAMGIDMLFIINFNNNFSKISAKDFVEEYLLNRFKIKDIIVGEDFKFGRNREGNIALLHKYSKNKSFNLISLKKKGFNEETFSSSLSRTHIEQGNITAANKVLGYYWEVSGKVVRGEARGRNLGFPTANLKYLDQISPSRGIYATWVKIQGEKIWRMGAVSTGIRPHYEGKEEILEVYVINFSGNLYEKRIRVAFVKKIRDEEKFISEKELIRKMHDDCLKTKNILKMNIILNNNR